jgi:hypothetical protein
VPPDVWSAIWKFGFESGNGAYAANGKRLVEVRFKIGFNTRLPGPNRQRARADAEHRINSIDPDPEFRNQQVAGSTPAGGSSPFSSNHLEN